MSFLEIKIDVEKDTSFYNFTNEPLSNCFICDFENLDEVFNKVPIIVYIGSVWYDLHLGISNVVGDIAAKHSSMNFCFKLVRDESVLNAIIPKELKYNHLPIILFISKTFQIKMLSSGPITPMDLENKINIAVS